MILKIIFKIKKMIGLLGGFNTWMINNTQEGKGTLKVILKMRLE